MKIKYKDNTTKKPRANRLRLARQRDTEHKKVTISPHRQKVGVVKAAGNLCHAAVVVVVNRKRVGSPEVIGLVNADRAIIGSEHVEGRVFDQRDVPH